MTISIPYLADCRIKGERRFNLPVTKMNTYTCWVEYDGKPIKRHFSKHDIKLAFIAAR